MLKWLYVALGHVFLVTGVIGVFTPIIPGTPLIILAAVLYAKGSPTFYNWLTNHKYLGSIVKRWQESDEARRKMRMTLIAGATLGIIATIVFIHGNSTFWLMCAIGYTLTVLGILLLPNVVNPVTPRQRSKSSP